MPAKSYTWNVQKIKAVLGYQDESPLCCVLVQVVKELRRFLRGEERCEELAHGFLSELDSVQDKNSLLCGQLKLD